VCMAAAPAGRSGRVPGGETAEGAGCWEGRVQGGQGGGPGLGRGCHL